MDAEQRHFPKAAGVLFGLGLGGFFDGIVLHQLLQWHHMLSSWYPENTIENLELDTLWDGIFHSTTYLFVVAGLFVLWRSAQRGHLFWSSKLARGHRAARLWTLQHGRRHHQPSRARPTSRQRDGRA